MCAKSLSRVWVLATPWIIARQAPLSMGFSRQETEVGCHALLQGIFQTQGLNRRLLSLLHWQAGSLSLAPSGKPNIKHGSIKSKKKKIKEIKYTLNLLSSWRKIIQSQPGWCFPSLGVLVKPGVHGMGLWMIPSPQHRHKYPSQGPVAGSPVHLEWASCSVPGMSKRPYLWSPVCCLGKVGGTYFLLKVLSLPVSFGPRVESGFGFKWPKKIKTGIMFHGTWKW